MTIFNSRDICRCLWQTWAPHMEFEDAEFDATAASWGNPDWVETTLHAYRVRWGAAPEDPRDDALELRRWRSSTLARIHT